jgi:hypothetical protein
MKGIQKKLNDYTKDISLVILNRQFEGRISSKLKINEYTIRSEQSTTIYYNLKICKSYNDLQIAMLVYETITKIKETRG